jgi:hypothetical protein
MSRIASFVVVVLVAAGGCGGDSPDAAAGGAPADRVGAPAADSAARDGIDPASPGGVDTSGRKAGEAPETVAGSAAPDYDHPAGPWADSEVTRAPSGESATLIGVRAARHDDGYDRFVLEFQDGLPGYRIRYPADPLHQCGSGRPIDVDAPATLQVELRRTVAHDDQGNVTVGERALSPGLPVLRSARLTCDYEGIVEWVLGVEGRAQFRAFTLREPARLVVDIRHR